MRKHGVNIFFYEENYKRVKDLIERRKISNFINELVEKNFQKEEQQKREELRKKLVAGYKSNARNEKLKKNEQELSAAYEEWANDPDEQAEIKTWKGVEKDNWDK